jgi:hypothetical protein
MKWSPDDSLTNQMSRLLFTRILTNFANKMLMGRFKLMGPFKMRPSLLKAMCTNYANLVFVFWLLEALFDINMRVLVFESLKHSKVHSSTERHVK